VKRAKKNAPKARPKRTRQKRVAKRPRESQAGRRARAERVLALLRNAYPDASCALHHDSALRLLVATILSAQCTDERVNMVTPNLFRRYPDARAFADAAQEDLEAAVRSTGFFRNKAKSLRGMGQVLCERFGGEVPATMEELLGLPGVARKTANCVLGTWFHKNVGIVVDTHVGRIADRLGLAPTARDSKDAERIERDLMELFPEESWTYLAHALIDHGRQICSARKPKCSRCPLAAECPSAGSFD
jgi:endonuclease-3